MFLFDEDYNLMEDIKYFRSCFIVKIIRTIKRVSYSKINGC